MAADAPIPHPEGWPVVRLGEIALKIGSGATPTGGEEAYLPERSKFALVRSQNVFDRRFDRAGMAFISDEQADRLKGVFLQESDILGALARGNILGQFARVYHGGGPRLLSAVRQSSLETANDPVRWNVYCLRNDLGR
jgi:hypothetical protein